MKASKIYVGINGKTLALNSGEGVAVYPAQKGNNTSHILLQSGQIVRVNGARINGVGVPRFLKESGFELAKPGNPLADMLAEYLDMREGLKRVEAANQHTAFELQQRFAGQTCTFVPFDDAKQVLSVKVAEPRGYTSLAVDMLSGFTAGTVQLEYERNCGMLDATLSAGWLVGPDEDASAMPRCTEYGGLIEQAVYVICQSGLATLVGPKNLEMDDNADEAFPFPRGSLKLALENGDHILVGVDAGDDLVVRYVRDGNVLYSRTGMPEPRLAEVIGVIAAVMVRVDELDAKPVKKAA